MEAMAWHYNRYYLRLWNVTICMESKRQAGYERGGFLFTTD